MAVTYKWDISGTNPADKSRISVRGLTADSIVDAVVLFAARFQGYLVTSISGYGVMPNGQSFDIGDEPDENDMDTTSMPNALAPDMEDF